MQLRDRLESYDIDEAGPGGEQERSVMRDFETFVSLIIAADTRELEIMYPSQGETSMSDITNAYQDVIDHIGQALPKVQAGLSATQTPTPQSVSSQSGRNLSSPTSTRRSSIESNPQDACEVDGDDNDISVAVSAEVRYRIRTSIRETKFVMNMKRSVAEVFKASFAADVPDLTRYLDDERVFAKRALDRLAFGQRDILVDTSELAAADFDSVVSTAGVYIRKQPERSDRQVTTDDIVITRNRIEENPDSLLLTYLADGDSDAELFNKYQYRVDWTLKGGVEITGEWQDRESAQIPLAPPVKLRTLTISLDPDFVERENIAAVTVRLYSNYGGKTEVQEVQIQPNEQEGSYSTATAVITPRGSFDYEIEKIFARRGQSTVRTERELTSDTYIILSSLN